MTQLATTSFSAYSNPSTNTYVPVHAHGDPLPLCLHVHELNYDPRRGARDRLRIQDADLVIDQPQVLQRLRDAAEGEGRDNGAWVGVADAFADSVDGALDEATPARTLVRLLVRLGQCQSSIDILTLRIV